MHNKTVIRELCIEVRTNYSQMNLFQQPNSIQGIDINLGCTLKHNLCKEKSKCLTINCTVVYLMLLFANTKRSYKES